jgi:small conductance mechanosensitive channel
MPSNWPELTLAVTLALVAAYIIADVVARVVESVLRAILPDDHEQFLVDRPKRIIRLVIFAIIAVALAFPALAFVGVQTDIGASRQELIAWLMNGGLRIALIGVAGYMVIRIGTAAARRFETEMSTGSGLDVIERTKRAQTLGRLLQKTLSIVVTVIAGLMVLRELDVDITPVLTGAGIVGLAVGFGAQTLVRDVISGFFLILEDQVRVGDVAVVNGTGGLVEAINLRTIVLRDFEGTVHVFPNGEIKTLANRTKDFSYYVLELGISYGEDPDRVASALREIAASLALDERFTSSILEPIEIAGIDAFGDSQITLKARIKTVPLKQWEVGRELRRRILHGFRERNIEIPFPQRTVWLRSETKSGPTPGAPGTPLSAGPRPG